MEKGLPSEGIEGFWTLWERFEEAPAEDGIVSESAQLVRSNRSLFIEDRIYNKQGRVLHCKL